MRTVLIATGFREEMMPLLRHRPTPLLNVADKPILFHIIESLVNLGIQDFDLVLSYLPEMIEKELGDGDRWGINIQYHLTRDPMKPFSILSPMARGWGNDLVFIGQGDNLPKLERHYFNDPALFQFKDQQWSGWGIVPAPKLGNVNAEVTLAEFPKAINLEELVVTPFMSAQKFSELQAANQTFMKLKDSPHLFPTTAKKVENGVWISRAVSIHPSVKILPPIFIGENTQIKKGVHLGPNAVIENNCIIDDESVIENSIICQKSYVGETLEVKNSIIDRNLLINLALDSHILLKDDFLLSDIETPNIRQFPFSVSERFLAAFFLLLFLPIFLFMWLRFGIKRDPMVVLPSPEERSEWKTFQWYSFHGHSFFRRLPLLINILRGEVHFVGVSPRSTEELEKLSEDWQKLYLKSKVGVITLTDLEAPGDNYAAEAYYAAHMSEWYDIKLFCRWIKKKIESIFQ